MYRYAHASGRSRFCAVALSDTVFAILGGETDESMATPTMKTYDVENEEWITQPEMAQNRKDHACLVIEIDGSRGEFGMRAYLTKTRKKSRLHWDNLTLLSRVPKKLKRGVTSIVAGRGMSKRTSLSLSFCWPFILFL